ncbi:disease resistance protein RPM1 [Vigna unguiculata]|uniref:Disease resistance protein RPM1 n=1 Tax=Vigna unguiculata TaxID=3917 RepID=A0A4D6MAJ8_VIGUN|nr:disease resistance protein RPM1 [Vigna unguiculata]
MAEYFVFDIAESLLRKLASFVCEEASRVCEVYEDIKGIKDTLSIVKGVLLDAEHKKEQRHGLREWIRQIQTVCLDAEDVLDGLECQNLRKQVLKASDSTRMKVAHFFSSSNSLVFRFRMAHQIKHVRRRLDKIAADGNKFGLERIDVDNRLVQRREVTYSHVDASGVIGRESDREEIIKLLMQPHPHGDGCGDENPAPTIALAHQENIKNFDIEQLQIVLKLKLSGQKYFLVLDDIWNDNRAKWIELKDLIKVGAVGSKILVTTRSNSIASMMGTVPSYVLEGLSMENCYALFNKWAFKEGEEKAYSNLVEIGKEIVKKCRGVPLAVRTLGSSLFLVFDLERWEFVRDHEIWNIKQNKDDILPALKLSYDQMPSCLRHIFAFFSLYPKDYGFCSAEILILWESLGLLQSLGGNRKLENIARQYIDELHARSFLEDFEDFGHYYYFKVHDLVHDLALFVGKEEHLMVNSFTRYIPEQIRGCMELETLPKSLGMLISLRKLYITTKQSILPENEFASLRNLHTLSFEYCPNLKLLFRKEQLALLEVLIIQSCRSLEFLPLHVLPKLEVLIVSRCEMLNLNYGSPIHRLRMKFLHIEHCPKLHTLPQWIEGSVETLRTLLILNCHTLKMFPEWITTMSGLKRLHIVNCPKLLCLPGEMHSLTALDDLTIEGCPELCRKCEPKNGEFWSFIAHIKRVSIGETRKGKLLVRMLQQMRLRLRDQ